MRRLPNSVVASLPWSDDADERAAFDRVLSHRRANAPEMGATSLLSPRETRTLFPPLRADLAGLHVANGPASMDDG
jgi:D-amino-acid dehydrogenase